VDGMGRRPERFIGNYTGGENLTIRGTCRGDRCMCPRRRRVAFHFIRRTFVEKFERYVKEGSVHEGSSLGNLEEVSFAETFERQMKKGSGNGESLIKLI